MAPIKLPVKPSFTPLIDSLPTPKPSEKRIKAAQASARQGDYIDSIKSSIFMDKKKLNFASKCHS